jgi:hypothetical protein
MASEKERVNELGPYQGILATSCIIWSPLRGAAFNIWEQV